MNFTSQNWIFASTITIALIVMLVLLSRYYAKYTHSYINDAKDLAKHHDKYQLYFLVTGIFFPTSEALMELFKVREESELIAYLIVGVFCIGIAIISNSVKIIRRNLHKIFIGFFIAITFFLFYNIVRNPTDIVTVSEFTMFAIFAYYSFYNVKHFYIYLGVMVVFLFALLFLQLISPQFFILYINSCFISYSFNYGKHIIDLNIRENLLFTYNFVNKGTSLLVVGVNEKGKIAFVSENIKTILGYDKAEWNGKDWQNEILNSSETVELDKTTYLQKVILNNDNYKLIEWREEPLYKDLIIKIGKDVTERRQTEIELKRTKELLEQTNRVARVGGWEFNLVEGKGFSSEVTKEIFEVPQNSEYDFQTAVNYFEEGEHRNKITQALENCMKDGTPYDFEIPIITAKGKKLWVRAKGQAEFENEKCKRIYGIVQDIDEQVKARDAVIQSEEKFRFISENTSDVIIVFDKGKVVYLSPAHEKLFGYSADEAIKIAEKNLYYFVHPDDKERIQSLITSKIIKKQTFSCTYIFRFLHKNGNYVWREDSLDVIYGEGGLLLKTIILARDISERKAEERANQERQEKQFLQNRLLAQISTTPFHNYDSLEKNLQAITEAAATGLSVSRVSVWDYTINEIICNDLYEVEKNLHSTGDVLIAKDFPQYFEGIQTGLAIVAHEAFTHQYTYEFAETYLKPLQIASMLDVPIRVGGELIGILCCEKTKTPKEWTDDDVVFARSIADIISVNIEAGKRRKAEIELKRTKEILEQTSLIARIGGWEIIVDSQEFYFSDINKEILEAPPSFRLLDLDTAFNFYKEGESKEKISEAMAQCFRKGTPFDIEVQIVTLKGNERWVRAMGQSEFQNGQCKRLFGTFQDIDEQVKLNQIIKDKELQYRTLISNISSVTFRCLTDEYWTMIFISDAIQKLTGYPASDFINNNKRNFASIVHPDDVIIANANAESTLDNEEYVIEYRILDANNDFIWVNEKGRRYFDKNENRILLDGIITDINKQKLAEIALTHSYEDLKITQTQLKAVQVEQEKFVSLVKNSDAFIGISDMKGQVFFLNEKAKLISGYGESYQHTFASDYHTKEASALLKNVILPEVLKKGMWRGEHDVVNSVTKEIRYTDATMFVIKDTVSGENTSIATIQIDITERKNAEIQLLENQQILLYKSQILAAIAKITEKLLISNNIEQTLHESFTVIGEAINIDRVYYFANNIETNRISMKVEWVRESISPQINNPATQNQSFDDIHFYTELLLQNKIYQNTISSLDDIKIIERWKKQDILSVLLFPIFIKNTFYGFIGFDDCTHHQLWSDDTLNIIQSLATNIANAIERINNEKIIKESENNFRQLNETIEDVFMLYDMIHRKCIYVSPSAKSVLGVEQEYFYLVNNYIKDYLIEEDQSIANSLVDNLQKNNSAEAEYRIKTQDGQVKWIYQKSFGIKNEKNELIRISAIFTDITEKKLIQNKIKQLSLVAEKIINGVLITNNIGQVLWANQALLDMMEISSEHLFGKRPRDLFNPESTDFTEKMDIMDNYNYTLEVEVLTFKKNKKWVQINNTAIKVDEDNLVQQIEIIIDITERKKAEMLLKESEEKFRFIAENTSDGIFVIENTLITYISPSYEKILGYTFEESIKNSEGNLLDLVHPEDVSHFSASIKNAISAKCTNFSCQYRSLHKDGHYIWREDTITVIYDGEKVYKFISVVRDITMRKNAEMLLTESERKLNNILNSLDEVVWAISIPDRKPLFVSNSFERVFDATPDKWLGNFELWKTIVHPDDKSVGEKVENDVLKYGAAHEIFRIIDKDGHIRWLENTLKIVKNENNEPFMVMGITTDITDRKTAEKALIKAQEETDTANKAKAELELRALQMQMNPHFVFNALNAIQSYVMNQDAASANNYLTKFAQLIRLFLDSSRSKFIPLEEEIRLLTLYIELEKIRFDENFDFEIVLDKKVSKYFEMPTMILQPFVENAINHGLRYKKEKGLLSIKFTMESDYLICKIEDNGVGRKNAEKIQAKSNKGYQSQGLKITAERLMTYNKINEANIVFSVNDLIQNFNDLNDEVGTIIEIKFPEN